MKLATWNVNSIKARHERVLAWLAREQPDVLCLQELKLTEDQFPFEELLDAGYHSAVHGQKTYNGVAILSKEPLADVTPGMGDDVDDPQARLIEGRLDDVRILSAYFPNGKAVGSDKYEYKLAWMRRLLDRLRRSASPAEHIILCGDMNVAPDARDVAFPDQWDGSVLCHQDARDALARLADWGLTDVYRDLHPEAQEYSWWDYRMLAFPKGNGLRIDHILATASMAGRCAAARMDRDERKGTKPSDHVPVIAEFE